ncbi:zinc finger and SCAN domain-containing protein 2-like [Archocentrus centrarchus]|uniref:zinc finger and SCAN domain-containing protein 2-like n=1 Tax=Archocentrus centrarchus TaxID=63155 RepID=UPI0011EA1846|nr:zinc finger and SCAN domain-containing protein 2-like [Archocentrus centrarchus]
MASVQHLRDFIRDRLTAAAEDIFSEFEKSILQYEKKQEHQRRLREITWSPVVKLHVTDIPQQHSCNQEERLTAQQLWNQERNSSPEQENPESPQIKEEQQELCSSQQGQQAVQKQATDTVTVTVIHEESDHSDPEPAGDQLLSHSSDTVVFVESKAKEILEVINKCVQDEAEIDHQRRVLDRTWNPVVKLYRTDLPQQHVCKLKEVLADQQLCNQERNSSPEQENPESPQIKEEQQELCSSQQGQQAVQTQTGLCPPAPVEPIVAPLNVSALSADSYLTLKTVTFTGKKLYPCNTCGKTFTTMFSFKRHSTIHTGEQPHLCTTCGRRFRQIYPLTVHMRTHRGELPYVCNTCGKVFK